MLPSLTLRAVDDFHLHLRDGVALKTTVPHAAKQFARAIIMPNLKPPILNVKDAQHYQKRIFEQLPKGNSFQPLMTLYLTEHTPPEEIKKSKESGVVFAAKLYPAGVTTNAQSGVKKIQQIYKVLETMQKHQLPLLIHGESNDESVDIFSREAVFIEKILTPLLKDFPELKMVLEHISTQIAVDFIKSAPPNLAATLTAHHLMFNRNQLLSGGLKPHFYCLPILKSENDRKALVKAATSGNPKFFLGTDSAPHTQSKKENACGAAGCYTAFYALSLYLEVFEKENALFRFEDFASTFGARFYGLPLNEEKITLIKKEGDGAMSFPFENERLIALSPQNTLHWQLL